MDKPGAGVSGFLVTSGLTTDVYEMSFLIVVTGLIAFVDLGTSTTLLPSLFSAYFSSGAVDITDAFAASEDFTGIVDNCFSALVCLTVDGLTLVFAGSSFDSSCTLLSFFFCSSACFYKCLSAAFGIL